MNEKLREALGLALQYVPAESKDPLEQEEIDNIHLLVKEGTEAIPIEPPVKPEIVEEELRKLFRNNSDCYADTWKFGDAGRCIEGDVILALTEDKFIEIVKKQFSV